MVEKQDFEILLIGQKVHLRLLIKWTPMSTIQNLPHTFDYKIGTPENNKLNKQNAWETRRTSIETCSLHLDLNISQVTSAC